MSGSANRALQQANRDRHRQAGVRNQLENGRKTPADYLDRERVARHLQDVPVVDFLQYLPGVEEMAAKRLARHVGAGNPAVTLGSLSLHTRRRLVHRLDQPILERRRAEQEPLRQRERLELAA